jgi:hypothetical protein
MDGMGFMEQKPSLLSQYDEPFKKQSFRLGAAALPPSAAEEDESAIVGTATTTAPIMNLDLEQQERQLQQQSDYLSQAEAAAQFRPKRKKQRQTQMRRPVVADLTGENEDEFRNASGVSSMTDGNFVDDEDLQRELARSRQRQQTVHRKRFESAQEIAEKRKFNNL